VTELKGLTAVNDAYDNYMSMSMSMSIVDLYSA